MERKIRKKLIAILLIITILATDFLILGSNLITYGTKIGSETNNPNIEFSAYFKNDDGQRTNSIEKSIKSENLRLYAEIIVKNEGYFNGLIEIDNSNFNIKDDILPSNTHISSIDGNKVNLKQINHGETVEVELGIEPIYSSKISADMLSKISIVKLNGSYTALQDSGIQYGKEVSITFHEDEFTMAELETDIITNKVFSVNGVNKRVVQLLIKSRLMENQYPVEQTTLNVNIPKLSEKAPEEIDVLAVGKLATNGLSKISKQEWNIENETLQININNKVDNNNEIAWNKNVYDKIVITYIYPEDVDSRLISVTTKSELKVYNSEKRYKAEHTENESQELNNIIMAEPQVTTEKIYKGQLYANINATEKKDIKYDTVTTLVVTNANIAEEIVIHEGPDSFGTNDSELKANTKYISTEINKEKMLQILGIDGKVEIKSEEKTIVVNKDTEENENGNIVINYENNGVELDITTSKPVMAGILEIKHIKAITENTYTRAQLQTIKTLKNKNKILATLANTSIIENVTETNIELKETISKAELTINKKSLSTTETNEVTLGVKLITDGEQYDLYKNPTIKIQLPSTVENVELVGKPSKLYADGFEINSRYNTSSKIIEIKLNGEQIGYPESLATQMYLQLNLNMTLSKIAPSKTDKIIMTYSNENAIQYDGGTTDVGVAVQNIEISSPSGLLKMFNLSSNQNTSLSENIIQQLTKKDAGKKFNFETVLINNTGSDMNNVRILGKLPTEGNDNNTLETTLKSIDAPNATVYYTENENATDDVGKTQNGWTTSLSELTNAKQYLIKLGDLKAETNYITVANIQMPNVVENDMEAYTQYDVIYDTNIQSDIKETSRKIGLTSSIAEGLEAELVAEVGPDILNDGDIVKVGEVIKYTATIKNNGTQNLESIELKAYVPEGTVLVQPKENFVYVDGYYEENAEQTENTKTISLAPNETYNMQYEVRVKTDIVAGTEISNEAIVTYNGLSMETNTIKSVIAESNIRVSIKKLNDTNIKLSPGGTAKYRFYVENLSNEVVPDLDIKIESENFKVTTVSYPQMDFEEAKEDIKDIHIDEIPANGVLDIILLGSIDGDALNLGISLKATDSNNNICRSNIIKEVFEYKDATVTLSSPQNNSQIQNGDIIQYSIVAENNSANAELLKISHNISEYFDIQAVYVNEQLVEQTTNSADTSTYQETILNLIEKNIQLESKEKVQIDIEAKVAYILEEGESKEIYTKAKVSIDDVIKNESEEIKHTFINPGPIEEPKNVLSGFVWIDKNENGQKDSDEQYIEGITVKIYDDISKSFLTNSEGETIQGVTDVNGAYSIADVKDGSYIVVFEYDEEKYKLTTFMANGVDDSVNSKAQLQNLIVNGEGITVARTETIYIQENVSNINVGLIEKSEMPSIKEAKEIRGFAWNDKNENGQKDSSENTVEGIRVRLYDEDNQEYVKDLNGNIIQTTTDVNGQYAFGNIKEGRYRVIFKYNTNQYELTKDFAEGVNNQINSKIVVREVKINGDNILIPSSDIIDLKDDVTDINIGLIEIIPSIDNDDKDDNNDGNNNNGDDNSNNNDGDNNEGNDDNEGNDNNEDNNNNENNDNENNNNEDDDNGNNGNVNNNNGENDNKNEEKYNKQMISGFAWLDTNRNGQKDEDETALSGIRVKVYKEATNNYLKDKNGNIVEAVTDEKGMYTIKDIGKGRYIILFEYDTEEYEPTTYLAEGVDTTQNSKAVVKKININGQDKILAVTDVIDVKEDISNINIGLKQKLIFDLELNKYISRIVVQNNKETKAYDYPNEIFAKVEIHRKQIQGALVVLEYTIKVRNNGEISGYAKNIVDYLPKGLTFSSELNSDWYLSENYLYTKGLENIEMQPGEEKEIKLILTKTMSNQNIGLINNRAEIYQDYNKYGEDDKDSIPNNQAQNEDDFGSVDVIIGVSTGGSVITYIILLIINLVLIGIVINFMIKNEIIKIYTNEERR